MKKFYKSRFIFIFSFLLILVIANFYLNKFSNQYFIEDGYKYSSLYQQDTITYFKATDNIAEDVESGKKFYNSGEEYTFSFLYPRIIYFFNYIFNDNERIYDVQNLKIHLKNDKLFIYFQIIFFYASVAFLLTSLDNIIDRKLSSIICIFLLVNPVILQWHLSFYTESIFLSFLVLLVSFLIRSKSNVDFILIGIFVGLMYMQRTVTLLYPIVILAFIIFIDEHKNKKIYKFLSFLSGLILILILIGLHNYNRSGVFYFTPTQSKLDLQRYLEVNVVKNVNKISYLEATKQINHFNSSIVKKYKYDLSKEKDKIEYSNIIQKNSFKTLLENKVVTLRIILKNYFHTMLLNPVQVFYEAKYKTWIEYKKSPDHKFWLKIRLIVTPLFFIFSAIGFFVSIKKIDPKLNIFIFLSILYFFVVSCWLPNTRYFVPSVLFMSIYFSVSLHEISLFLEKSKSLKELGR